MMNRWRMTLALCVAVLAAQSMASPAAAARQPSTDIVGGTLAAQGEFPWMVNLSMGCGGSLLTPTIVLTAAHCLQGQTNTGVTAILGVVDVLSASRIVRHSVQILSAPGFNSTTFDNDWGLIKLDSSVSLATLPMVSNSYYNNGTFTVAGWGSISETGGMQRYLRKATVPFVDDATCQQAYSDLVPADMICAGYPQGGVDACYGDSGGPLFKPDVYGNPIQVGIVSSGIGCARAGFPGIYTEVSTYSAQILAAAAQLTNPITLSLSGPGYIPSKAKYTYTANTSGFVSPTYTWYEQFCDYWDTSCSGWVTITGLPSTFNRVLNKDCSATGEKTFHVMVTVHNSDGRELTDQMTTSLCEPL